MKLYYSSQGAGAPVVLLHGLFGDSRNLNQIYQSLSQTHRVFNVDLRNHGASPWSDIMNYDVMAQDIHSLIEEQNLHNVTLIGHSMGGKVAMRTPLYAQERVRQLIILDIAPVKYAPGHQNELCALRDVLTKQASTRQEADQIMLQHHLSLDTRQFLLKSFKNGHWIFNLNSIEHQYSHIVDWTPLPPCNLDTLFIIGGNSHYVTPEDKPAIQQQFPHAHAHIVNGASHWVHADKPERVLQLIINTLNPTSV